MESRGLNPILLYHTIPNGIEYPVEYFIPFRGVDKLTLDGEPIKSKR